MCSIAQSNWLNEFFITRADVWDTELDKATDGAQSEASGFTGRNHPVHNTPQPITQHCSYIDIIKLHLN